MRTQIKHMAWYHIKQLSIGIGTVVWFFADTLVILSSKRTGDQPVCKVIPWIPREPVQSMCFDPSGSWLLCCTLLGYIYIVPVATIIVSWGIESYYLPTFRS